MSELIKGPDGATVQQIQELLNSHMSRNLDTFHEMMDRMKFLTEKISGIETALGTGYISGSGYDGFVFGESEGVATT